MNRWKNVRKICEMIYPQKRGDAEKAFMDRKINILGQFAKFQQNDRTNLVETGLESELEVAG